MLLVNICLYGNFPMKMFMILKWFTTSAHDKQHLFIRVSRLGSWRLYRMWHRREAMQGTYYYNCSKLGGGSNVRAHDRQHVRVARPRLTEGREPKQCQCSLSGTSDGNPLTTPCHTLVNFLFLSLIPFGYLLSVISLGSRSSYIIPPYDKHNFEALPRLVLVTLTPLKKKSISKLYPNKWSP